LKDGISPGIAGPTQANPIFVVFEEEEAMAKTEKGDAGVAIVQNGAAMTVRTRGTINKRQVGDIVDQVEMIAGIKAMIGRGFYRG
jgi:hypothetical protein